MKNWKQIANQTLIENSTMQTRVNRFGQFFAVWLITPAMSLGLLLLTGVWLIQLNKQTFWLSIFWEIVQVFMVILSYGYYFPKGYRKYFYVACATPAVIGLCLTVGCVVTAITSGALQTYLKIG